jgi:hypothetical protein
MKKNTESKKPLTFRRETLVQLDRRDLVDIVGGAPTTTVQTRFNTCTCP